MQHRSNTCAERQTPTPDSDQSAYRARVREWLNRAHNGGNWFPFFRDFYRVLPKLTALFLQDLINLSKTAKQDGEWFLATGSYLEDAEWSVKEQDYHFRILRERGFVRTERRGLPPLRWVRIDLEAVHTALDAAEQPRYSRNRGESVTPDFGTKKRALKSSEKKNTVRAANAATDGAGRDASDVSGMDLLGRPDAAPPAGMRYTSFDYECASLLWEAIAAKHTKPPAKKTTWAVQFRRLREGTAGECAAVEAQIRSVLKWYVDHLGGRYVPRAFCAAAFRAKFNQIAAQKKDAPARPDPSAPVTVTPAAQTIADCALRRVWPKGTEAQIPAVAQISLDNLTAFSDGMDRVELEQRAILAARPNDPAANRLMRLLRKAAVEPRHYLGVWLDRVWNDVRGWTDWSGNLARYTFRADHEWVTAAGREWAESAGDPAETWDELMAEIARGAA